MEIYNLNQQGKEKHDVQLEKNNIILDVIYNSVYITMYIRKKKCSCIVLNKRQPNMPVIKTYFGFYLGVGGGGGL